MGEPHPPRRIAKRQAGAALTDAAASVWTDPAAGSGRPPAPTELTGADFNPARSRIPSLDGVRGLAILAVIAVHAHYRGPDSGISGWPEQLLILGWSGVDLFFVLSGFLITSLLLDAKGKPGYFRNFYVKRVARILPLYYAILVAFLFLSLINIPALELMTENYANNWWVYFLFLSNLGELFSWQLNEPLGPTWSLAVEEQYYIVWPAVVSLLSIRALRILAPLLLVGCVALRWVAVGNLDPAAIYPLTLTHADGVLIGSIIALYSDEVARHFPKFKYALAVLAAGLALVFWQAGTTHYTNSAVQILGFLLVSLLYGAFLVVAIGNRRVAALLSNRPLRTVGKYSYCMYLIHWPLLMALQSLALPDGPIAWILFYLVFTLGVTGLAAISWVLLEKPAATAIRRIGLTPGSTEEISAVHRPEKMSGLA